MLSDINVALVDDDKGSIDLIASSLQEAFKSKGYSCVIFKYLDGAKFLEDLKTMRMDVLFCDIEMPNLNGIELCKKIPDDKKPTIIFISNREDMVFDALQIHPFGFIRKKNFFADVTNIVGNYLNSFTSQGTNSIVVKAMDGKSYSLNIRNIMYIESQLKHQKIYMADKSECICTLMTMNFFEESLYAYGFIRCHKSYIVNYKYIYSILDDFVVLKNEKKLYLASRKVKSIKDRYLELIENDKGIIYR